MSPGFWWVLWFDYCYPSLKGNGPEGLLQSLAFGIVGYGAGHVAKKHAGRLHDKLDHIIQHHPDIPDFESKQAK